MNLFKEELNEQEKVYKAILKQAEKCLKSKQEEQKASIFEDTSHKHIKQFPAFQVVTVAIQKNEFQDM